MDYCLDNKVFDSNYKTQVQIILNLKKQVSKLQRNNEILKKDHFTDKKRITLYESIFTLSKNYSLNQLFQVPNVNKTSYF